MFGSGSFICLPSYLQYDVIAIFLLPMNITLITLSVYFTSAKATVQYIPSHISWQCFCSAVTKTVVNKGNDKLQYIKTVDSNQSQLLKTLYMISFIQLSKPNVLT